MIPDRRTKIGDIYIDLWKGLFRDTIHVWKDVFPALGGTIVWGKVRHRDSDDAYGRAVELVTTRKAKRSHDSLDGRS